jgi:lysophospholipase L1-like esterase
MVQKMLALFFLLLGSGFFLVSCQTETAPPTPQATSDTADPPPTIEPAPEESATLVVQVSADTLLHGVGLIGASTLDEYQGSENRGGSYAAVTYNMIEQLVILRGFNVGAWGDWGKPRRIGYEYNWARSGATSSSMIEQGQHTGVAAQVAAGEVTFVFILIGANDFGPHIDSTYARIYNGKMSDEALQKKVDDAIANVTLAADTVLEAGALGVGVALFPHWNLEPSALRDYPDPIRQQRVEDAISEINEGIRAMAAERGILVVDSNAFGLSLLSRLDARGHLNVGGAAIDFMNRGNEPHHARLNDQSGHTGTVLSGLMANYYFIEPLNRVYGLSIEPLSEAEILSLAGIDPEASDPSDDE